MYICKDCHFRLPSIKALCYHLQMIHSYNVFSVFKCAQEGCNREYNSIKAFRKHLKDKHPVPMLHAVPLEVFDQEHLEVNENVELNFNMRNALQQIDDQDEQIEGMHDIVFTAFDFKKAVFESSRALVAKLYASSTFNRVHVQNIIEFILEFLCGNFVTMLKSKVLSMLRDVDQRQDDI